MRVEHYSILIYETLSPFSLFLNGIDEAGESTLSEIVSLYIVFSHLLSIMLVY